MKLGLSVRRAVAIVAGVSAAGLGIVATAAPASADNNFCGWNPANNTKATGHFIYADVNIRAGGDQNCPSRGLGQPADVLEVRCGSHNDNDGYWWDYLVDPNRGVTGWSRDDLLHWQGVARHC
jgi:hypothetical protein